MAEDQTALVRHSLAELSMRLAPRQAARRRWANKNSPCHLQSLSWVFGASAHVKHGVVNLSDGYTDKICYLAANTAVIYDKRLRRQLFLQVWGGVGRAGGGL
jgi:hypothetical protein